MRKSNDQTLKEVLKEFAEQKKFKSKLNTKKLESLWFELFSSLAGSYTDKVNYSQGVLTVYISSSSLRKELLLNKYLILQQLNSKLKDELLTDLEFR